MKHRKEEDDLYRKFARQREEEEFKFKEEFRVSLKTESSYSIVIRVGVVRVRVCCACSVHTVGGMMMRWVSSWNHSTTTTATALQRYILIPYMANVDDLNERGGGDFGFSSRNHIIYAAHSRQQLLLTYDGASIICRFLLVIKIIMPAPLLLFLVLVKQPITYLSVLYEHCNCRVIFSQCLCTKREGFNLMISLFLHFASCRKSGRKN